MVRDITLGQYYPIESLIHKLDPRTKIWITFGFVISLFLGKNLYLYGLATVVLLVYVLLARIPWSYLLRGLKPLVLVVLLSSIFNLFFTEGEAILTIGKLTITWQGLRLSCYVIARLLYLIIGSAILTYTTTPTKLADAVEAMLGWMNKFHVPVHEIAMMISIAIRFIPILVEELDKIMKTQQARGAQFDEGNLFVRLKSMSVVIIPLFVSAIRRANDLAMAMEARCYRGGEGRTKMKPLKYGKTDIAVYGILLLYLAVTIYLAFFIK